MHPKSIGLPNRAVADEMTAVHQYMFFHFHCENQGYELLSRLFIKTAVEEMGHVERWAERIPFLGGEVEMEKINKFGDQNLALQSMEGAEGESAPAM